MAENKALFLDRDGVICEALGGYLTDPNQFRLMLGIKNLIRNAKEKGYIVIVVTNQPQVAKGFLNEDALFQIHAAMEKALDNQIDKIYFCPHIDENNCVCRKPKPGMLLKAEEEFSLNLKNSIMVGDSDRDVWAGQAAGCKTVFIKNQFKGDTLKNCSPDIVVNNLSELIL